jgi:hypothetical protein
MAAEEVIYFPFWAQLSPRPNSPAPSPPEPVAEPPPLAENRTDISLVIRFQTARRFVCPSDTLDDLLDGR